jgi:hypothetical protein
MQGCTLQSGSKMLMNAKWAVWLEVLFITLAIGLVDWQTGYELNFFVFYFLPISFSAWRLGLGPSIISAVMCALVWFGADLMSGHVHASHGHAVWNTIVRLISFLAIGWLVQKIRSLLTAERERSDTLHQTLAEIKVLEGLLPICAECKKIRDSEGQWHQMEDYISGHSEIQFSHGYCPECARRALEQAGIAKKMTGP